jgi:hypothetical protein
VSARTRGVDTSANVTVFPVLGYGNHDFSKFVCKSADADVGSGQLIAYQYDSPVCPEKYVRGVVLARLKAPGG